VRGAAGSAPPSILVAGQEPGGGPRWLVRDFDSIVSAPSAAAFVAARTGPGRAAPGGIVMFGPPAQPSAEALRTLVDAECADFLEAQVYTQPITAISAGDVARLGARAVSGAAFTGRRLAADQALSDYSVLVFSTHGFTGAQSCASEPGLLVSIDAGLENAETPDEVALGDPLLTASEVILLQLDADLVVLAACDTANMGRSRSIAAAFGSEHLDGLARAFLYAGARNVLATHWAVDDRATDAFVTRLLVEAQSRPLAEAVVATQNYFLDHPEELTGGGRELTPALWGGFVLIGDGARSADTVSVSG
jgi:CHAT domain-containing protein